MSEETNEEKTEMKKAAPKKVAPDIAVSKPVGTARTIDDCFRENPGQSFMYAAVGTSAETLAEDGLEAVERDGKPLIYRKRMICRKVGSTQDDRIKAEYDQATQMIKGVRDLETSDKKSRKAEAKKLDGLTDY